MMSLPGPAIERRPQRLLNRFAAAGRPQHLLAAGAARLALQQGDQPFAGRDFEFRDRVVSRERRGRKEFACRS